MNKSFNLIDKPWIPVSLRGEVSLLQVFTDVSIKELSGTVLENLSIFKLLLAISQAAFTPKDDEEWKKTNLEDFGTRVVNYLSKHHDLFDLYSEKPFLQFPILKEKNDPKKILPLRLLLPEVGSSNNPVLTDYNIQNVELDSVKARLLLQQMNFAFGGKKVDQKICLSQGHKKSASGANGVSLGKNGFLHSYYFGNSLLETIFLNLMTQSDIAQVQVYESGIGTPPWECMPKGEIDDIAMKLKNSYMGHLVGLNRFCLLQDDSIITTEGINYPSIKDGVADLSVSTFIRNFSKKSEIDAVWANPEQKPWRQLSSILSFLHSNSTIYGCKQIRLPMSRITSKGIPYCIWSLGIQVLSNSGEYYVKQKCDSLSSVIRLPNHEEQLSTWFDTFETEVKSLEHLMMKLRSSVSGYFKDLSVENISTENVERQFWESCNDLSDELIRACFLNKSLDFRKKVSSIAENLYNATCDSSTARQILSWSKHQLNLSKYRAGEK